MTDDEQVRRAFTQGVPVLEHLPDNWAKALARSIAARPLGTRRPRASDKDKRAYPLR
jgi:hypothetical protein